MAKKNENVVKMTAPIGVAAWPKLSEPDYGSKEYPKPDGEFSVKMLWREDDEAFVAFREELEGYMPAVEAMARQKFGEMKKASRDKLGDVNQNPLFSTVYDKDDEPTGDVEAKFSMKHSGIIKNGPRTGQKWTRRPGLFDAFGHPLKKGIDIWGGSELIVAFEFMKDGYFIPATGAYGIKLQLAAAQVVTLRQGGEKSASEFGFGKVDGGFDVSAYAGSDDDEDDASVEADVNDGEYDAEEDEGDY